MYDCYFTNVLTQRSCFEIDHLHNYGPGTRFGASSARIGCDVCVSHSSFRFSSALECRSAIGVVFVAVLIEAGLVLYSSLIVFRGQVSSGSAGYLPFVRLTDRTSASPTARSDASSTSSQRKSLLSCSCLKACRLFRDPLPVQVFETEEGWTLSESRCSAIGVFFSPADVSQVRVRSM